MLVQYSAGESGLPDLLENLKPCYILTGDMIDAEAEKSELVAKIFKNDFNKQVNVT